MPKNDDVCNELFNTDKDAWRKMDQAIGRMIEQGEKAQSDRQNYQNQQINHQKQQLATLSRL